MRLRNPLLSIVLFQLWLGAAVRAQEFPVIPFPQVVTTGDSHVSLQGLRLQLQDRGGMDHLSRLWDSYFQPSQTQRNDYVETLTLGVLGRDPVFDAKIQRRVSKSDMAKIGEEGYVLILKRNGSLLAAHTNKGLFYGLQTLRQLRNAQWGKEALVIDWPDFPNRIVMDDISRGPISTFSYIKEQIDRLSSFKINYLTFYVEHVVQSATYPDFSPANGKLTLQQIRELSDYAARNYMQLIGSFQSFGHFEKILSLPQYEDMGATRTMISPIDPKAKEFLKTVLEEYCEAFNAPYFNVNCDETWDLGRGKTKTYADSIGLSRFYAEHINFLHDVLAGKDKKMMMWGDIALQHKEIFNLIPKDIMFLSWEYGSQNDFSNWTGPFYTRNLDYMVCPGILNSNRLFPDLIMAKDNIAGFSKAGYSAGAKGVFTTIWDDGGLQLFSNDWTGVAFAAEKSWNVRAFGNFEERYEQAVFGCKGTFLAAIQVLLELRDLPLTQEMRDGVWRERLLPERGQKLTIETVGIREAIENIENAKQRLKEGCTKTDPNDLEAFEIVVEQYGLLLQGKRSVLKMAADYNEACRVQLTDPSRAKEILASSISDVGRLSDRYKVSADRFRDAWLRENQPYSLDLALIPYHDKIAALDLLQQALIQQTAFLEQGLALAPPIQIGLEITEDDKQYFKNWLLLGSIPLTALDDLPDFIYNPDPSKDIPPDVGSEVFYNGNALRWEKFESLQGGIVDLGNKFVPGEKAVAYAYCSVDFAEGRTVQALVGSNDGMEVFLNGEKIFSKNIKQPFILDESTIQLQFKEGRNDILLKITQWKGDWKFSFRLDREVRNHKHRYSTLKKN